MSKLDHENIARYHQVWLDDDDVEIAEFEREKSSSKKTKLIKGHNYLCLQLTLYPRTMKDILKSSDFDFGGEE